MTPCIRVYRADLTRFETAGCVPLLSKVERHRAASISDACARHEFVTTRALVRLLLSRQMNQPADALEIAIGRHGKPLLPEACGVHFNVSHSSGTALIAISSMGVGVDIERIDQGVNYWDVAASVFSSTEMDILRRMPDTLRTDTFFSIWTRKEAYLKATGSGFSSDLRSISAVSPRAAIEDHNDASGTQNWFAFDLPAPDGFKAALVTAAKRCNVRMLDLVTHQRSTTGQPAWVAPKQLLGAAGLTGDVLC